MNEPSPNTTVPHPQEQNGAVARCAAAWQRTYELASIEPKNRKAAKEYDGFATEQARGAFRDAMPPLAGSQNIQDFIACIAYARLHNIFLIDSCDALLRCARIALAATPRPQQPASTR